MDKWVPVIKLRTKGFQSKDLRVIKERSQRRGENLGLIKQPKVTIWGREWGPGGIGKRVVVAHILSLIAPEKQPTSDAAALAKKSWREGGGFG